MAIKIKTLPNGILFDLSDLPDTPGIDRDKFVFRPSRFHAITKVTVNDKFIQYWTINNEKFSFNFDGANDAGSQILEINTTTTFKDNYDLFNKFIELLQ